MSFIGSEFQTNLVFCLRQKSLGCTSGASLSLFFLAETELEVCYVVKVYISGLRPPGILQRDLSGTEYSTYCMKLFGISGPNPKVNRHR